jgi:transcriptional regulator with XRE-family HTH domain
MKQQEISIANNLQQIREDRNLSLDKLAELTGVSKSMLRQIEIGQSNPTITTVWKIANGLQLPFAALFREQSRKMLLRSFKDESPLISDVEGFRLFPLLIFDPNRSFEIFYAEIEPGVRIDAEPHQGNAEEHVFVLNGELVISVGDNKSRVEKNQLLSFQADCPHSYINFERVTTTALMLISYSE